MFNRIMVAFDNSSHAHKALRMGYEIAKTHNWADSHEVRKRKQYRFDNNGITWEKQGGKTLIGQCF